MTLVYADRVQETFTTTGTGTISLAGPVVGYQAFGGALSDTNTCYYTATDGTNWETGLATYAAAGNTLARTTIYESSNANSAVNWASGTKNIWLDLPAFAINSFSGGLTVGTTAIASGVSGRILYDNAGAVGELAVTGTGDAVLNDGPTFIAPVLGTPASGNLSNCTGIPGSLMTPLGVGSIVMGVYFGTGAAGSTVSGSNIQVTSVVPSINTSGGGTISLYQATADTLTGTWKALMSYNSNIILWQRTA